MSIRLSDMTIHEGLVIVTVDGFETKPETVTDEHGVVYEVDGPIDLPGSANWLCDAYGMSGTDMEGPGILYTDYDGPDWRFSVLIDAEEAEEFQKAAREAGYDIHEVEAVTEPLRYGDGGGCVEILKHRDGWIILEG